MNKKIFSLVVMGFASCVAFAQLPQRVQGNPNQRNEELLRQGMVQKEYTDYSKPAAVDNFDKLSLRNSDLQEMSKVKMTPVLYPAYKAPAPENETKAFYWKPDGTFFIGVDRGLGNTYQGIVGSWLNVDAWVFPGSSTNYKEISFSTYYQGLLPEIYYTDQQTSNWHDTIVAVSRGSEYTFYSYDMPYLTVANGNARDTFALCADTKDEGLVDRQEAVGKIGVAATMAGVLYPGQSDKMWPLTNAMTLDCELGNLILKNYSDSPLQYYIGTTDVTPKDGEADVTPDGFISSYQAPQSTLYVKDITLWLEAYTTSDNVIVNEAPVFGDTDTLFLTVESDAGEVLYSTYATKDNLKTFPNKNKGGVLTFNFTADTTEYGEVISEGIILNDAFKVRVTGIADCTGDFSVVSAMAPYGSNTDMILNDASLVRYAEIEPYLMLNGIFPTLYDAYLDVEDTLQVISLEMGDRSIREVATFDETQLAAGYVPALYSYFYPIDTLKQVTNISFQGPEWITWGFDDSDWAGETYTDMIYLYFFADELPEGVDFREGTITLSSFGKTKTYYVYQGEKPVEQQIGDGTTDLEESNVQPVKVYSLNGQFNLTYPDVYNAVEVYAVNGNKIASYSLPENGSFSIDNSSLANGVYLIRMIGETSEVLKVVK